MKNLLIAATALLAFTSCEQPTSVIEEQRFNDKDGWYKIDLVSTATSGFLGGVDTDTTFYDVGIIATDYGTLYTLNMDSAVTPLPLLGINFEATMEFVVTASDTAVVIGNETWYYANTFYDGEKVVVLSRFTDYFGMGTDLQQLILTELW